MYVGAHILITFASLPLRVWLIYLNTAAEPGSTIDYHGRLQDAVNDKTHVAFFTILHVPILENRIHIPTIYYTNLPARAIVLAPEAAAIGIPTANASTSTTSRGRADRSGGGRWNWGRRHTFAVTRTIDCVLALRL
jgi:hypothetical protein